MLEASPNYGYQFEYWDVGGTIYYDNPLSLTVSSNLTITAVFSELPKYYISVDVSPSGAGKILLDGTELVLPCTVEAYEGDVLTLEAVPNEGYRFLYWSDGTNNYTDNPLSFTVPASNITLVAYFEPIPVYVVSVDVTPSGVGKVLIDGVEVSLPYTAEYYEGTQITIEGIAVDPLYKFDHWEVDGQIFYDNPLSLTVSSNTTVLCVFVEKPQYTVSILMNIEGAGTIYLNGQEVTFEGYLFREGEVITLEATPNRGYKFSFWDVNGTIYYDNPVNITVTEDLSIVCNFEALPEYYITLKIYGMGDVNVNGITYSGDPETLYKEYQIKFYEGEKVTIEPEVYVPLFVDKIVIDGVEYEPFSVILSPTANSTVEIYVGKLVLVELNVEGEGCIEYDGILECLFPTSYSEAVGYQGKSISLKSYHTENSTFSHWEITIYDYLGNEETLTLTDNPTTFDLSMKYDKVIVKAVFITTETATTETTTSEQGLLDKVQSWWGGLSTTYRILIVSGGLLFILIILLSLAPSLERRRRR